MRLACLASAILLTSSLCHCQSIAVPDDASGPSSPPKQPISFDLSSIDTSVDPCVDFYRFACGKWMKDNPIPDDKVRWSQFDELHDHNDYLLYLELKSAAAAPKTPLQIKYGNYYAACMNVSLANQLAAKPIAPELAAIAAVTDKKNMAALDVEARRRFGGSEVLGIGVEQDQKEAAARVQARTNPHSTGEWRVKGAVQNFDEFGKAFSCKVAQPMMPVNACRVW